VTSGVPSPSLKVNIGMGFIQTGHHMPGTDIQIKVRNKLQPGKVVKMPFVPSKYRR
jgi:aminomethyltransferase